MYIFIKIFDNNNIIGQNSSPFIIEDNNLNKALSRVIEKYYDKETCEKVKRCLT